MSDQEDNRPPPTLTQPQHEDDVIKILLATDNHIGYMERDPIRGQDSINTFREILQLAVKHDVDFILLAGDLFHENRPSRGCLYQTMALLREYTLGDKPIQVELLSNPDEGKADGFSFPAINYEDGNLNVAIPVFSIHGNHDDPQGAGPEGALCALDMLSVAGLMNYMGKFDLPLDDMNAQNTGIAIRPVLLRKGLTRLGMYGVGNVKDQRMHFELRSNRVRMFMPRDKDDWFNILLIHQNRVKHGPQESVPEGMFDDSIDLVVWGHEHDCRIIPEPVAGKKYYITQPGSSVATSLADGESIEKHVALLKIQGKDFQLDPLPLRTVRPFVMEEVDMLEAAEERGFETTDTVAINAFLKEKVNELIDRANELWSERNAKAVDEGEDPLPTMLPLVRLKVDTTGFGESMSNPVRFGQEFYGRIANPRDVLIFHRSKRSGAGAGAAGKKAKPEQPELSIDDPDLTISEKLNRVRVQTLVSEFLAVQEPQLLGEGGMNNAIQMFVEKDDSHAIQQHVNQSLRTILKNVHTENIDEEDLEERLRKARDEHNRAYDDEVAASKTSKGKSQGAEKDDSDVASVDSMMMDVESAEGAGAGSDFEELDSDEAPPPPKKKAARASTSKKVAPQPKKAAATKSRGKAKAKVPSEDEDEDESEIEEISEPPPKKKTSRAAAISQPAATTKRAPAKKKATAAPATNTQTMLQFTPAPTAGRSTRTAASKARSKINKNSIDFESD